MSTDWISTAKRGFVAAGLACFTTFVFFFAGTVQASDGLPLDMIAELEGTQPVAYQQAAQPQAKAQLVSHEYVKSLYADDSGWCNDCGCGTATCECESSCESSKSSRKLGNGLLRSKIQQKRACPEPWWAHRTGLFGELLYLAPGSSDIIHVIEATDPPPAVLTPTGPVGIVDIDANAGYRTGFSWASSPCSSLNVAYTNWSGKDSNALTANGVNVLVSQVVHPSQDNAGAASVQSAAQHDMAFQFIDANYRHIFKRNECTSLNWFAGLRYANLEQDFVGAQLNGAADGLTNVTTDIDFEGFGITGGLDLERYSCSTGLFIYAKGMASLLAGEWEAAYRHDNDAAIGGGVVANEYEDFHATPILEGEIGLGWLSKGGMVRLQSGYTMSGWYQAVSTRGYIDAVRNTQLIDLGETMTFSGLTSRVSILF